MLYVERNGAVPPQWFCPRIAQRETLAKGGLRQAESLTTRPNRVKSRVAVFSLLKAMTETQTQTPEASIELLSAGLKAIKGKYIKKLPLEGSRFRI